jgi:hypothetical protein
VDIMADHGAAPASVGRIEIHGRYTVVDMKTPLGRDELRAISQAQIDGRELRIRPYVENTGDTRSQSRPYSRTIRPGASGKKPRYEERRKPRW